jgi:hypothetical protein
MPGPCVFGIRPQTGANFTGHCASSVKIALPGLPKVEVAVSDSCE